MSLALVTGKEFQKILELARALILEESLGAARLAWVPTELRSAAVVLRLFANDEGIPGFMNEGLVKKAIDDARVHPVTLGHARFEMTSNMLNMTLAGWVES